MSFEIDVVRRLGEARIALALRSAAPLVALVGRSGIGKTSVLNMVAGLLRPDAGRIAIADETLFDGRGGIDLPPERRRAGYVFQEHRLFPHRRVRANLLYGAQAGGAGLIGFDEAIDLLGIRHLLDRWPRTLSGGEAQRVAIGRALLSSPRFLLMDEPLAALDRARRDEIAGLILRIRDTIALPILLVTHDEAEVGRLGAERVAMVD